MNIFFFQWLRSSFIRYYNHRYEIKFFEGSIVKSYLTISGILGIFSILLSIVFKFLSIEVNYIFWGFILLILLSIFEMLITYFRTVLKPKIVVNTNFIKVFITLMASIILIIYLENVMALIIGSILGLVFGIFLYIKKLEKNTIKIKQLNSDKSTQRQFLKYGIPITFSFALSVTLQNIDKLMISAILGLQANGNYAVSYDLIHNLIYMIMSSLSLASFPLILKEIKSTGIREGKIKFVEYGKLLLFISIPTSFGLALILEELTSIVIGLDYKISNKLLVLIIYASLFHGIKSFYFDLALQISGKTKYFFIPAFVAVALNVILNSFLLKKYGIDGAAIATALSFFVAMILSAFYSKKSYSVPFPWLSLLKILVSSLIMYLCVENIDIENNLVSLIVKVISGSLIYLLISILMNSLNLRKVLLNKVRKR